MLWKSKTRQMLREEAVRFEESVKKRRESTDRFNKALSDLVEEAQKQEERLKCVKVKLSTLVSSDE